MNKKKKQLKGHFTLQETLVTLASTSMVFGLPVRLKTSLA